MEEKFSLLVCVCVCIYFDIVNCNYSQSSLCKLTYRLIYSEVRWVNAFCQVALSTAFIIFFGDI